ncbi:YbdD/YjiX family protein [Nocardioides aurantiacus]|uniref:Uncharacterized protein DUF466 n=1 Tax=Nocardioides aurantiacus TaxID=86796 RepID=A0A3N2CV07_9ACTN|nr:YbdD/YjiX family protein [Nocardioides aurantiacus]ROR91296.1 uncharacterized protein DUF466 [Nocardioides aurantiacus]
MTAPLAPSGQGPLRRALAGVRWYARELSGEAKWDQYVARCAREGTEPMSRRAFERHRDDHRENGTQQRCC